MFDLSKLVDGLRLPAKTFFAITLASGSVLFSSDHFLGILGLGNFVKVYRSYIGAAFVISGCMCLVTILTSAGKFIWPWIAEAYVVHYGRKRLRNLNPEEKQILSYYIENQTREQTLSIMSGAVRVLEIEKIILRASSLGHVHGFSYAMQPWAWEFLNKNPDLLK